VPLTSLIARLRSLWRGLRRRADVEAEMAEEFQHHLALRTEDLVRRGLAPAEAARRARLEFGHIDHHKEDARASRGLRLLDQLGLSWIDVKLGLRMFTKYPGLSLVSVVGMAVAIAIAAGVFGFLAVVMDPALPLPGGARVVSIENITNVAGSPDRRVLHDFTVWREQVRSLTDLGAFMSDSRNLVVPGGPVELVGIAQITASGFRVAGVPPVLGRPLLDEDERPGAPPVVVIAAEEWKRRSDADPGIIGRQVRLGSTVHTVVGVMPEGFRFPVNHRYWVPLQLDPDDYEPGGGPALFVFGRLADGVTLDEAQSELTTIERRIASAYPESHEGLRTRVMPYPYQFIGIDRASRAWAFRGLQVGMSLLLVVIAVNVAILVYARTAARAGEIAVRTALGASRARVVAQLFVEALVLSGTASVIGLTIAGTALGMIQRFQDREWGGDLPFWLRLHVSTGTVLYVVGLAVLAAAIVGILPGLKATGRRVQAGLQQLSQRGSRMQLGRTWTALIVVQVAVAVAVLPFAVLVAGQSVRRGMSRAGYPVNEVLRGWLSMEREEAPPSAEAEAYERAFEGRFHKSAAELLRRLEAEPAVSSVTFARTFLGGGTYARIEVERDAERTSTAADTASPPAPVSRSAVVNNVDVDLFRVLDVPILVGRGFDDGDRREGANTVIVNRVFAEQLLGGGNAVGRRVRFLDRRGSDGTIEAGPWLAVVGVVPDFTIQADFDPPDARLYEPMGLARAPTVLSLAVRIRNSPPSGFTARFRDIAASVDPALQLHELQSAADAQRDAQRSLLALALVIVAVTASVVLLSAAGIYAMMSFTVARRRREIGIRTALGADPRRILTGIFARASAQLGAGVLAGLVLATVLNRAIGGSGLLAGTGIVLLPIVAVVMIGVGLLAALGPARRGLAIEPTEALREE